MLRVKIAYEIFISAKESKLKEFSKFILLNCIER